MFVVVIMTWALLVFLMWCGYVCCGCYDLGFAGFPYSVRVCMFYLVSDVELQLLSCTSFPVIYKSFYH